MKRPGIDGGFLLCLGINMILNLGWTLPAWILLACHFIFGISLWWFVGALAAWLAAMVIMCLALSYISRLGAQSPSGNQRLTPEEQKAKDEDIRTRSANIRNK